MSADSTFVFALIATAGALMASNRVRFDVVAILVVLALMLSGSQQLVAAQGLGRKTREQIIADAERHIAAIASLVGEEGWMVGDAISLADLSVVAELRCLLDAAEAREIIKAYPQVSTWMSRVDEVAPA